MDSRSDDAAPRPWWALALAVLLLATATVVLTSRGHGPNQEMSANSPMLAVAPGGEVALAALPEAHQALYQAAADDPDAFTKVRCYCGCEAFLDHRHLLDCFVRPDGGWERHATGCAICLAEAGDVVELRDEGIPIDEISRRIDRKYGAITDAA